ncbi:MAG: glycosyltransferase family 4 protein [Bacillota bacterium]|nr:glycosyltransferase family 4 protein [Bacillota bacterium]
MNVVQVGTGFIPISPSVTGGAEKYIHYLSTALQRLGHQVTVIDMPARPDAPSPYRRLEVPLLWRYDSNLVAHAVRGLLFGRASARQLERLIQQGEVELVNFHSQFTGVTGIPIARRHGIPAVFTMHNPLWSDAAACQSRLQRIKFWLEQRTETQADAVIGLSGHVTEHRVRYFGLSPAKATVEPVGVDGFWFESRPISAPVKERYAPGGELLILHVGRIAPYKNQLVLAQALPRLLAAVPNARLVFVGPQDSSPYLRRVQAAVSEARAEANVVFAGAVSLEELAQLYGLARIFVLPSLQENCPQVLLEAMAQGKAIVASAIPPLREMLPEGTGELVPPLDHEALAETLIRLLRDDGAREKLGARARQRAYDVYRWEKVAGRVVEVYHQLARRPAEVAGGVR